MKKMLAFAIIFIALVCLIVLMRTKNILIFDETETEPTVKGHTAENNMDVEDERPIIRRFTPEVVTPDEETIEKLSVIKERMRKSSNIGEDTIRNLGHLSKHGRIDKETYERIKEAGPQSPDDAFQIIINIMSMAHVPTICAEYEGIFFFSGGRTAYPVTDFSFGIAIKKGGHSIYIWDKSDLENK